MIVLIEYFPGAAEGGAVVVDGTWLGEAGVDVGTASVDEPPLTESPIATPMPSSATSPTAAATISPVLELLARLGEAAGGG
ncbi:hypothetical protein [Actinocrispum wychmicini]|uniref:hypothetical protein n=1 Tax=Actinocrispum wychmicini TaxID=1213861 RepID=UPI00104881FF|nr:hypothetical protein [Actinocrispum wychmicini]